MLFQSPTGRRRPCDLLKRDTLRITLPFGKEMLPMWRGKDILPESALPIWSHCTTPIKARAPFMVSIQVPARLHAKRLVSEYHEKTQTWKGPFEAVSDQGTS